MANANVLILNGPPGVGKTTVAAELRELLAGTVVITGDALRAFAPADARARLGGGATHRGAGVLAGAYLDMGAARVIFDYVFARPSHFRYFAEVLSPSATLEIFTLWAPLELVVARDQARPERDRIGTGVRSSYLEMQHNLSQMGQIIENAESDPKLAAARIHELARGAGRAAV